MSAASRTIYYTETGDPYVLVSSKAGTFQRALKRDTLPKTTGLERLIAMAYRPKLSLKRADPSPIVVAEELEYAERIRALEEEMRVTRGKMEEARKARARRAALLVFLKECVEPGDSCDGDDLWRAYKGWYYIGCAKAPPGGFDVFLEDMALAGHRATPDMDFVGIQPKLRDLVFDEVF